MNNTAILAIHLALMYGNLVCYVLSLDRRSFHIISHVRLGRMIQSMSRPVL